LNLIIDDSNNEKLLDKILNRISFLEKIDRNKKAGAGRYIENFLCLVSGWTSNTIFVGPIGCVVSSIGALMYYILDVLIFIRDYHYGPEINFKNLITLFNSLTVLFYLKLPLIINQPADNREYHIGSLIGIGGKKYKENGGYDVWLGEGWIHTVGLNGIQEANNGRFVGNAMDAIGRIFDSTNLYEYNPGVRGFIGYGYKLGEKRQHYYIGSAWLVNVFKWPSLS
jgi:hypothetical protein